LLPRGTSEPVVGGDEPVAQEQAVVKLLNGDLLRRWAEVVLGTLVQILRQ